VVARNGRSQYTVAVDYGEAQRAAQVAAATATLGKLQTQIDAKADEIVLADGRETTLRQQVAQAFNAYVVALTAMGAGDPLPSTKAYTDAMKALGLEQAKNAPGRFQLAALRMQRKNLQRRLAQLAALTLTVILPVWRVTWEKTSEAIPVGGLVALGEINGEPGPLTVILQHVNEADAAPFGYMRARELATPEQAFFNVSILPGWQKFKPTVRWGTLLSVDYEAQTFDVALAPAPSSAQGLGVNQAGVLLSVARDAILEGAAGMDIYSFMPGDAVVVRFLEQAWGQPRVVGFLSNPHKGSDACVFRWVVGPVYRDAVADPLPDRGGVISSHRLWRGNQTAAAIAPNMSRIGYVGIGWTGTPEGIGFERSESWDPDDEFRSYGGDYGWMSFLNNGYGEDYPGSNAGVFLWGLSTGTFCAVSSGYDDAGLEVTRPGCSLADETVATGGWVGAAFSWSTFGWSFVSPAGGYHEFPYVPPPVVPLPIEIKASVTISFNGYTKRIGLGVQSAQAGIGFEVVRQDDFFLF
jgi:hypothetical protein